MTIRPILSSVINPVIGSVIWHGGGDATPALSPSTIAKFAMWLDDTTHATTGSAITGWNDKSGNSRNWIQTNASLRPTQSTLNSKASVLFDEIINTRIERATLGFPAGTYTMFQVFSPITEQLYFPFITANGVTTASSRYIADVNSSSTATTLSDNSGTLTYHNNGAVISPVTRQDLYNEYDNEINLARVSGIDWSLWNGAFIGNHSGFNGWSFNGHIGEVIVASGLTAGEITEIEAYLAFKWTTPLADVNISFPVSYRWRADTSVATIGSAVTSWTDSVGSFALSQATGANQPEFVATEINGKPVIRFESTKFMTGTLPAALAAIPDGNNTMLMVIKERGATQNQIIAGALNNSSAHRWGHRVLNGTKHGVNNTTFASNVNSNISVTGSRLDSLALIRSGADLTLNVSGVVTTDDVAVNPSFTTSNIFSLGRQGAAGFEEYAQVDIAEMVMLNRAISASELDDWHNYVHQRYGVTIV